MLKSQELAVEAAEVRGRLNDLLGKDEGDLSEEESAELEGGSGRLASLEKRRALALRVEASEGVEDEERRADDGAGDAEARELVELRSRYRVGRVIGAHLGGRRVDGAEAEYAEARGLGSGQIPVDVWQRPRRSGVEERAVTPGVQTGVDPAPIVPAIFDPTIAAFLGVAVEMASVGDKSFPVLSTKVTADVEAKGASADETAGAFTVTTVQPRRVTGSFRFQVEDEARMEGLEAALRLNLSQAMSDRVDDRILNGSGSGDGSVNGLLNILTDPAAPEAGAETWSRFNAAFVGHVDGVFATDAMGVRGLAGVETYRLMASSFLGANPVNAESFAAYASRAFGGVRASKRIAAPASDVQQAVMRRSNPAGDRVAAMAMWPGITIRDIYSGAGEGEVVIVALALVSDVVVLRSDAFVQDSFRLA